MNINIKDESSNQSLEVVDVDSTTQNCNTGLSFLEKYNRFKQLTDDLDEPTTEIQDNLSCTVCLSSTSNNKNRLSIGLPRQRLGRELNPNKTNLIQKLTQIRNRQKSNDIETLQAYYGDVLDFIEANAKKFERNSRIEESNCDEPQNNTTNRDAKFNMVIEKMDSVGNARDKFYQIQQQVKDLIEQLELVERYKMESVE